jgi:DDE superfamily endonuclease
MMFAPLEGWRHVKVTDRHTAVDYAHVLKDLADLYFANAKTIVLVQDNLNIHSKASLYEAFPAAEARRLVERFEWHYTPKHGSVNFIYVHLNRIIKARDLSGRRRPSSSRYRRACSQSRTRSSSEPPRTHRAPRTRGSTMKRRDVLLLGSPRWSNAYRSGLSRHRSPRERPHAAIVQNLKTLANYIWRPSSNIPASCVA